MLAELHMIKAGGGLCKVHIISICHIQTPLWIVDLKWPWMPKKFLSQGIVIKNQILNSIIGVNITLRINYYYNKKYAVDLAIQFPRESIISKQFYVLKMSTD